MRQLLFVLWCGFAAAVEWLFKPPPEAMRRAGRDEKARRLREAQKGLRRWR